MDGVTFRIRETVWINGIAQTSTALKPFFNSRPAAVNHVRRLQEQFDAKGFDQKKQVWWARRLAETPIHRWMIEETAIIE